MTFATNQKQTPPVEDSLPLFVYEDYRHLPLKKLFILFGVPVYATPKAWTNPFFIAPLMLVASFVLAPNAGFLDRVALVVTWVLLFQMTSFTHAIGHILGGTLAGSPMDRLIITNSRQPNIYDGDQSQYPPRVHLLRALGGPVANLIVGVVAGLLFLVGGSVNPTLFVLAGINLIFGVLAFAPIPSVDGEVIARYLFKR